MDRLKLVFVLILLTVPFWIAKLITEFSNDEPRFFADFQPVNSTPGYYFLSNYNLSFQNNHYLPPYKLHYCKIDKNAGSALQAVFCYLFDPKKFEKLLQTSWTPGLYQSPASCAATTTSGEMRQQTVKVANKSDFFQREDIFHFAVIRNPVDRLVSAWLDVCRTRLAKSTTACYGCGNNLTCFLTENYSYIRTKAEGKRANKWTMDWHFYPQSWHCDFEKNFKKYKLIRYDDREAFVNEFVGVLRSRNASQELADSARHALTSKSTSHANSKKISEDLVKSIYDDRFLFRVLHSTYYNDFRWFGFH